MHFGDEVAHLNLLAVAPEPTAMLVAPVAIPPPAAYWAIDSLAQPPAKIPVTMSRVPIAEDGDRLEDRLAVVLHTMTPPPVLR